MLWQVESWMSDDHAEEKVLKPCSWFWALWIVETLSDSTKTFLILSEALNVFSGFLHGHLFWNYFKGFGSPGFRFFLKKSDACFFFSLPFPGASSLRGGEGIGGHPLVWKFQKGWKWWGVFQAHKFGKLLWGGGMYSEQNVKTLKGFLLEVREATFHSWSCWLVCSTYIFFAIYLLPLVSHRFHGSVAYNGLHVSQVHPLVLGPTTTHESWATCQVVDMNKHICKFILSVYVPITHQKKK